MKNSLDMTQPVIAPQATARGGLCSEPRLTLPVVTRAEADLLLPSPVLSGSVKSFGIPLRAVPHGAQPVPRDPSLLQPMSMARGTTQIQVQP